MAEQDEDLVDVDPHDPGDGTLPVYRWRQAGPGLATCRQPPTSLTRVPLFTTRSSTCPSPSTPTSSPA
ncbi:hypothetical protein ACFCZ6_14270 [Streptomyces hydrogenans]|uniref:hypothetical protein n=1 Tax=Streptomyces hydrogenans TaxID=1873719 RepID=UPI0035DAF546